VREEHGAHRDRPETEFGVRHHFACPVN
jgi:hypothetical protein